jgi:hypothetical protein
MFKKTLIAAAVATVASTAAMADVTVSGAVESTLTSTDSANMVMTQDAKLVFKASEDLGNGMTASAINLFLNVMVYICLTDKINKSNRDKIFFKI